MKIQRVTVVVNTIAFLVLSAVLVAAQMQMPNDSAAKSDKSSTPKTLTGVVSDSMCGANHMAKDKTPAECTRLCIKQGQKYALVVGTKLYTLQSHEQELDKLAGQRVTVKGTMTGDTLSVTSVAAAKKTTKKS